MTHITRGDLTEVRDELRDQILQLGAEVRDGFSALREEAEETRRALSEEIKAVGTQMRVLHEDLVDRIARLTG
jgi:predicted amino acid-binding ACT domain protein